MVEILLKIQKFLKSSFFIELVEIFSLIGIGIFVIAIIIYPMAINLYNKNKTEKDGRNI
jgi:hypothetical protein